MSKKDYIVVKKHTLNHKIGDTIKLDERQAQNLSGKVKLKTEVISEEDEGYNSELQNKLQEELAEAKKELKSTKTALTKSNKSLDEALEKIKVLSKGE
ncbi:MAG: hypothetical protein MJK15_03235 [Colwellia sp.]|nr:hypothetical protein [Colwellia sp.]